jgi:hypothetical protein
MSVWGVVDIPAPGSGEQRLMVNVEHDARAKQHQAHARLAASTWAWWYTANGLYAYSTVRRAVTRGVFGAVPMAPIACRQQSVTASLLSSFPSVCLDPLLKLRTCRVKRGHVRLRTALALVVIVALWPTRATRTPVVLDGYGVWRAHDR